MITPHFSRSVWPGLCVAAACLTALPAKGGEFLVGSGIYDITGAAAEVGMMGYARPEQEVNGIHMRQRARAFVVVDPTSGKRVVFVSADLGQVFQSVKLEVVKKLKLKYGTLYDHDNVMLTATHTHVGGAAGSHYPLYIVASADTSTFGYSAINFNAIVAGIVAAIDRAHLNAGPASVDWLESELTGVTRNRSMEAYNANVDAGRYASATNTTMTQLRVRKDNGKHIGLINWFAVHPTSFSNRWRKLSGDSKGYAAQFFERAMGADYSSQETFVAAFAQGDVGDIVATAGNAFSAPGYEGSPDELKNVEIAGRQQLDRAQQMFAAPATRLVGRVDYRHQWVGMTGFTVRDEFTQAGPKQLCASARGFSFSAGGENGPVVPALYPEGATRDQFGWVFFDNPCHWPKPVLLPTAGLVPNVLPFQILKVGQLAIVGVPFELTTMTARRLRAQLLQGLAPSGVQSVVMASLANTYSGYLTTFEEYQRQHYEGASTEFGPYSLAATQQILGDMARAMAAGEAVRSTATPPDKLGELRFERPGVVWDSVPLFTAFGQVLLNANATYSRNAGAASTVKVAFRGGHPKNNIRTQSSFLFVERQQGSTWVTVARDWDWETSYQWTRVGVDTSSIDIEWRIPADAVPGTYRIRHVGDWKSGWTGAIKEYSGVSRTFTVR